MARSNRVRHVTIEGTVSPVREDEGWDDESVTLITPEGQEYLVAPVDEGQWLADHLYELVRVRGEIVGRRGRRRVLQIWRYDVLQLSPDEPTWDEGYDEDLDDFQIERLLREVDLDRAYGR